MKECSICREVKALDQFYKQVRKNGYIYYNPECRDCRKKKSSEWQLLNKDKKREYQRKSNKRPEAIEAQKENNKVQLEKGSTRLYQLKHPEKVKKYNKNRRHKNHNISAKEWKACKEYFNNTCAYCDLHINEHFRRYGGKLQKIDLHKEHVLHNGENDLSNCIPSCMSCNSQKHDKLLSDWYNSNNDNYTIEKHNKIMQWLNIDFANYKE